MVTGMPPCMAMAILTICLAFMGMAILTTTAGLTTMAGMEDGAMATDMVEATTAAAEVSTEEALAGGGAFTGEVSVEGVKTPQDKLSRFERRSTTNEARFACKTKDRLRSLSNRVHPGAWVGTDARPITSDVTDLPVGRMS